MKRIAVALTMLAALTFAAGAEESKTSQVVQQVEKKAGEVKDWAKGKYETVKAAVVPAKPLGKTVVLRFSTDAEDMTMSISSAMSEYQVEARWTDKNKDRTDDLKAQGTIQEQSGAFLISCEGELTNDKDNDHTQVGFKASALIKSGEKKLLVEKGNLKLFLAITVEPAQP
jgi:hypothetical protein